MSKELTPLEALENIKHYDSRVGLHEEDYKIIETALKKLEFYNKELNDLTADEDFEKIILETNCLISKKIKALEIIKEKGVAVGMLQLEEVGLQEYNDFIGDKKLYLTQEEYDLLKEVLL